MVPGSRGDADRQGAGVRSILIDEMTSGAVASMGPGAAQDCERAAAFEQALRLTAGSPPHLLSHRRGGR